MAPAPNWSQKEFEILLQNARCTDEELSGKLPGRSAGAIATVRAFIHNYHKAGNVSGLSELMIRRLEQGSWTCPQCDEKQ